MDEDRDLWKEAWRRPERPAAPPPRRRRAEIGGRDAHLTYELPAPTPAPDERSRRGGRDRARGAADRGAADRGAPARTRETRPPAAGARALVPRRAVIDYRRRRRLPPAAALGLAAAVALAGAAALSWWLLTRPAAVAVVPVPSDALVRFPGSAPAAGTFSTSSVEPGPYRIVVSRTGFVTTTVTMTARRGETARRRVRLTPLPQPLTVSSRPAGARVTVACGDGTTLTGRTPCTLQAPAGPSTITVTRTGYNTFTRAGFLDEPSTMDLLLDPAGQVVHALGSLATRGAPKSVSISPDGREAWTAILNGPPSIEIFDLRRMRKVGGVDLGKHGAVEVIFNRAGTRAYASQMETARVFEIDVARRTVLRSLPTESSWTKVVALSPDERTLYAANWSGDDVSVIDLTTGRVRRRVAVARTPRGLWPTADGTALYVAGFEGGDLERIDLRTFEVTRLLHSGGAMRHLVADEARGVLYASDMGRDRIWKLDMRTGRVTRFCTTDHKPNTIDLSGDGRVLFISNRGENNPRSYYVPGPEWGTVLLYDTRTGKPLDAIIGGNQCTALDVSADGSVLVFSDFLDDRLRVYAVPPHATLAAGRGGRFPGHTEALKKRR